MVRLADAEGLDQEAPRLLIIDPRSPMRYLSGHLPRAINVPAAKAFTQEAHLLPTQQLVAWLGELGVEIDVPVLLYDEYDGQQGCFLAWLLEYFGHLDVRFLRIPFQEWKARGREVAYRPVAVEPVAFESSTRSEIRADWTDVSNSTRAQLLDLRTEAEFSGQEPGSEGHIPGAKNIPWLRLVRPEGSLFVTSEKAQQLLWGAGVREDRPITAYCRSGPRAAVAYVVLQQVGCEIRVYDGSYLDWTKRGLRIET
jgi:thiosulfate/3-mercaptopyruvate sulfurtransferase